MNEDILKSAITESDSQDYMQQIDNTPEYYLKLVNTSASEDLKYEEINRDIVMSHLDVTDSYICNQIEEIILDLKNMFGSVINSQLIVVKTIDTPNGPIESSETTEKFNSKSNYCFIGELMARVNIAKAKDGKYATAIMRLDTQKNINITSSDKPPQRKR